MLSLCFEALGQPEKAEIVRDEISKVRPTTPP